MPNLPVVAIFAPSSSQEINLQSSVEVVDWETGDLDCRTFAGDENLEEILVRDRPDVLVTFGPVSQFSRLAAAPYEVQRRWVQVPDEAEAANLARVGELVYERYLNNLFTRDAKAPPLVSVFTPTYRTGSRIQRPLQSLLKQTHQNWEWVVVEDSGDDGETMRMMQEIAGTDHRVTVHAMHRHSGNIGELKRRACSIAQGEILVELDHDDELTPDALELIVKAFAQVPQAGFVYSDWTEIFEESGESVNYGVYWAFGYGSYQTQTYNEREVLVAQAPNINAKTIRHIVGVPNHVRAWRRNCYMDIGGHNAALHVADDYELLVRTFLETRMVRIPRLCYVQYMNAIGNTQDVRRKEIQRLVRHIAAHYDKRIHKRFVQLGVNDFVWNKATLSADNSTWVPNPHVEPHCTLLAKV